LRDCEGGSYREYEWRLQKEAGKDFEFKSSVGECGAEEMRKRAMSFQSVEKKEDQ